MKYLIGMMALAAATVFAVERIDPSTVDPNAGPFLLNGNTTREGEQVVEVDLVDCDFHPVRYEWLLDFPRRFSSFPAPGILLFIK